MWATPNRGLILASALTAALLPLGCGEDDTTTPDPAADEAAITEVLIENELGGPERCTEIYTDAYLELNYNEDVTSLDGDTPLEKCESDAPYADVTAEDLEIEIVSLDSEAGEAVASAQLRAQFPVGFTLVRDGESWRIDGFSD